MRKVGAYGASPLVLTDLFGGELKEASTSTSHGPAPLLLSSWAPFLSSLTASRAFPHILVILLPGHFSLPVAGFRKFHCLISVMMGERGCEPLSIPPSVPYRDSLNPTSVVATVRAKMLTLDRADFVAAPWNAFYPVLGIWQNGLERGWNRRRWRTTRVLGSRIGWRLGCLGRFTGLYSGHRLEGQDVACFICVRV